MLIQWEDQEWSVVVGNDDGAIRVWHPSALEKDFSFTYFSGIYNRTEAEIRESWGYREDQDEEYVDGHHTLRELLDSDLSCKILNDREVAWDTN